MSFHKKHGAYIIRFSSDPSDHREAKENVVLHFNKQKSIIGFDFYPPIYPVSQS